MPPTVEYWDDTVTPFLFWISKGDLTRMTYAEFHGLLIAMYILNEFKWIFLNIRPLVELTVFPDIVFKSVHCSELFFGNIL